VVVGQEVRYGDGAVDGRTRNQAQSKLEGLQGKGPVPFVDENGIALTTLIVAGMTMTQVEATLGDASARRVMTVDLQVAVLATTGTPWLWNDGTTYGQVGKSWS
jgi:hypothetical protein